jgi:hypothetical protein
VLPLLPSPAGLLWGFPLPLSSALRAPFPLCSMSFLLLLLIIQLFFFLFSLGRGQSVQGAMLVWPRIVCGSTAYHLAHLVVRVSPRRLGAAVWRRCGSPPGFSVQCEVEMLCAGWRCGGVKVLPLLGGLSCKVLSPASLQDFTLGGTLSASSL